MKKTRHIAKNKLNLAKKVNTHADQCLLKVRAKNLLRVSQNEEVMAMNCPPASRVVFLSSAIKIIKRITLF